MRDKPKIEILDEQNYPVAETKSRFLINLTEIPGWDSPVGLLLRLLTLLILALLALWMVFSVLWMTQSPAQLERIQQGFEECSEKNILCRVLLETLPDS
ncbi:MAG: hypothetical protein HRT82_17065 [Henriciella sp.]|nr:hypothetical protein [Henriciella sp.]